MHDITGLDIEFSYPATLAFLDSFKIMCENVETFGYPIIQFDYQRQDKMRVSTSIPILEVINETSQCTAVTPISAVETRLM